MTFQQLQDEARRRQIAVERKQQWITSGTVSELLAQLNDALHDADIDGKAAIKATLSDLDGAIDNAAEHLA